MKTLALFTSWATKTKLADTLILVNFQKMIGVQCNMCIPIIT